MNSLIRAAGLTPAWRQLRWRTRPRTQRRRSAKYAEGNSGGWWTVSRAWLLRDGFCGGAAGMTAWSRSLRYPVRRCGCCHRRDTMRPPAASMRNSATITMNAPKTPLCQPFKLSHRLASSMNGMPVANSTRPASAYAPGANQMRPCLSWPPHDRAMRRVACDLECASAAKTLPKSSRGRRERRPVGPKSL